MTTAPWMPIALRELGTREVPGAGDNPRIVDYHQATSLRATDDEVPWCSSFVNWTMKSAGLPRTGSAAARSWVPYGEKDSAASYGAIVVLSRGHNPALGHVGFLIDRDEALLWVLGGNQGDAVTIAPFAAARIVALRWPAPAVSVPT